MKLKRSNLTVKVDDISPYDIARTLNDVIVHFNELLERYGPNATLEWDPYFHYPYDQTPSPRFILNVTRLETDQELKDRQEAHNEATRHATEKQREEYMRLKKLFEEN